MLTSKKYHENIRAEGFTLIEMLIVLAISAMLVSFAYPAYNRYLESTRRTDAQSALVDLADRMEQYYLDHHTYAGATIETGDSDSDVLANALSVGGWYRLSITEQDDTYFMIQATPQDTQTSDTLCQSLTLTNTGIKGITSGPGGEPSGSPDICW